MKIGIILGLFVVFILGCAQKSQSIEDKLPIVFANIKEPVYLSDSLRVIVKEYKTTDNPKYMTLRSKSMMNRNTIFLLSGACGYEIMKKQKPCAYAVLDSIPIFFYGISEATFQNRPTDVKYENAIRNLIGGDTLPCLYNPANWIIEISKDSIRCYRNIEEYHKRVDFYQPTTDF